MGAISTTLYDAAGRVQATIDPLAQPQHSGLRRGRTEGPQMTRTTVFLGFSLVAALFYCPESRADTAQLGDIVELVRTSNGNEVRTVLSSAGAARFDFRRPADHICPSRTMFVPLVSPADSRRSAKEVSNLAKAVAALVDGSVEVSPALWAHVYERGETIVIRCRPARDGKVRTVRMSQCDLRNNLVWKGVVDEIEFFGGLGFATAIDAFYCGEAHLAKHQREQAVAEYQRAVTTLEDSQRAEVRRLAGPNATYEPEVSLRFEYPHRVTGKLYVVAGVPPNAMELPGITVDWAITLLRHGWEFHTEGLSVLLSEGVMVLSWKELRFPGGDHRVLEPAVVLPPNVISGLKKLPAGIGPDTDGHRRKGD
jgi:hypothetical protein